jgi:hypothetical protein
LAQVEFEILDFGLYWNLCIVYCNDAEEMNLISHHACTICAVVEEEVNVPRVQVKPFTKKIWHTAPVSLLGKTSSPEDFIT